MSTGPNRREFLQAAAASALPLGAGTASAVRAVLIDERHREARAFGARFAGRGVTGYALPEGDITEVWRRKIGPAWKREPFALAGLTERPALFCLEQLGWSCGLRVLFHGEHVVYRGGTDHSLLRGAEALSGSPRGLERAGARWPALLADALAGYPGPARRIRPGPSLAALAPALPDSAQLLTSWIIAPA